MKAIPGIEVDRKEQFTKFGGKSRTIAYLVSKEVTTSNQFEKREGAMCGKTSLYSLLSMDVQRRQENRKWKMCQSLALLCPLRTEPRCLGLCKKMQGFLGIIDSFLKKKTDSKNGMLSGVEFHDKNGVLLQSLTSFATSPLFFLFWC